MPHLVSGVLCGLSVSQARKVCRGVSILKYSRRSTLGSVRLLIQPRLFNLPFYESSVSATADTTSIPQTRCHCGRNTHVSEATTTVAMPAKAMIPLLAQLPLDDALRSDDEMETLHSCVLRLEVAHEFILSPQHADASQLVGWSAETGESGYWITGIHFWYRSRTWRIEPDWRGRLVDAYIICLVIDVLPS
jgi:hypothetical protein